MKNKKFNKKKIAISVTSVVLVVAMLVAFVPTALASEDRSLEYIEILKQNESFKILEIAPTENDGVIGYYVKDSEPIANWKEKAAMLTSPQAREAYVNNDVNAKLLSQGVMSQTADAAPLYLESMYDEEYPWDLDSKDGYNELILDNDESAKVKGRLEETEPNKGDYISNDVYVPIETNFKNYFDYSQWRTTLGKTLKEELGDNYNIDKFSNSKILSVDKGEKKLTVFGSTETNWSQTYAIDPDVMLYDLSSVYESDEYYSITMSEDKDNPGHYAGGSFVLSLDAKVYNGKGQVSIIPYDANGNIVKFSPNISKQYWYGQQTVTTGHYEMKFTVPNDSNVKSVQIRFDVNAIDASATFSNVSVYKYNQNYFDIDEWEPNSKVTSNFSNNNGVITVLSSVNESASDNLLYSEWMVSRNASYIECDSNTYYNFSYHLELMPGGGKAKAYIAGYDKSGNYLGTTYISDADKTKKQSGTYSFDFSSGNAAYLVVVFNITGTQKAYFSNVSITKALDYAKDDSVATHRQIIDHFSNGDVGKQYGDNIFNFHSWYNSGSYNKSATSDMNASVVADESNGIITVTNNGATATSDIYKSSDNMYYVSVDDSSEYHVSYTLNSNSTASHKVTVLYCDENKSKVSSETFTMTPKAAGVDEYQFDFTTPANCRWIQLSFGNTQINQKNIFSTINLCKKEAPKVYYYSVLFTKIASTEDIETMSGDTPIYTPKYEAVTSIEEGETYYTFDEYSDEYTVIPDITKVSSGTVIYKFSGIYDYVGKAGDSSITFNLKSEYYTAEINYDGYTAVKDTSTIGAGTAYYTKDETSGDYIVEGICNDSTTFDKSKQYYINTAVIRETYDELHPYWVAAEEFEEANDYTALFTKKSDGYSYVGENKGNYKFVKDPDGDEEVVLTTSIIYYRGGITNNEWFKKGVLNCSEEQMNSIAVSVTTVTPTYLNSLDSESLAYFLQGYELFVISYGGVDGTAKYLEDISADVRSAIYKEATDTWETYDASGEEVTTSEYKIPVMIDSRVCEMDSEKDKAGKNFVEIYGLANDLCSDLTTEGGVNKYIYKYNVTDVKYDVKSIVNKSFLEKLRTTYTSTASPYYCVYKEIVYENFIRSANKDKYTQLDTTVSEATCIRYILNYRGQRIQRYKPKIRILEIQPYTDVSELLESDGRIKLSVKQWFAPTGDLTYIDENNQVQEIDLEVTTMAMGELAARNQSIVEDYDVIYVGSSLDNLDIVADHSTGGTRLDNEGHIIPDYSDDDLDGMYYTSTGDKVETGSDKTGYRAPLAGLVGTDYNAIRDIEIFGWNVGSVFKGTALDLWMVDASTCELRKSGNDMTVNIMEQIEAFADSGRPVIYSDDLVENEYVGAFSVDITSEIVGWNDDDNVPIIRLTADLDTKGSTLPAGVQPAFTWFCQTSELKFANESGDGSTISVQDIDGDGVNEGIYEFTFKEGDNLRGYGNYFAYVTFKFSKAKYKGLRSITNLRSDTVSFGYEDLEYKLSFTTNMKHNLKEVTASLELLDKDGYMPSLYTNGGQNQIFKFVWKSRSFGGSYGQAHNANVTYDPDPFTPGSGYDPTTCRKISTTVTFDEKRYDYQLSLYVDDEDPTLQIYYATLSQKEATGKIRYYKFTNNNDGTEVTSAAGIALNEDAYDNSSYTYECMTHVFANYQNVFSETMLNNNENLDRNNLIKYSNLSAPEIEITDEPIDYPETLESSALEFKFKILNYTDDTISSSRYRYEFYVDNNSDGKFSSDELTDANVFGSGNSSMDSNLRASTEETVYEYKFYKKFPEATSGIVPWKFVIIKVGDDITEETTHNSITRYAYIKPPEATKVTAVQILPANWSSTYRRMYDDSEAYGKKYSDIYQGSVFLSDVFVSTNLTAASNSHLEFSRVINYGIYSGSTFESNAAGTKNAKFEEDIAALQAANPGKTVVPSSIDMTVGTDFNLNVSFKNVSQVNETDTDTLYNELNSYDMVILGFGDAYGRHEQNGETGVAAILTNEGFQQGAVKALERIIDDGKATLFCHDTAFYSNNFVSYIANDIANFASESISEIENFFRSLFGLSTDQLSANLHSSRVKQGYYLNIGLRDKLGLDRYGVTKNIKDRIVARDNYNTYNDISYDNENLRDGHDYASIYYDGRKSDVGSIHTVDETFTSEMIWNKGETITVQDRIDEYLADGYDIAYIPGTGRQSIDVFFQGYSDFVIEKFRSDGNSDEKLAMTNKITQVNSGQITNYPYDIDTIDTMTNDRKNYGTLDIMPTHDQIYQVSLQVDDDGNGTTVWYALANTDTKYSSDTMTNYDSFRNNATNGYFIYTHKNVTYTGSGHTNMFTETEAMLFINTIVAAYRIVADKPVINYVTEDGQTIINYKTVTSVSDDSGTVSVEDDKIYYKLKDTSVDSEVTKSLSVKFYLTATPSTDENGAVTYEYSDQVGEVTGVKGNTVQSWELSDEVKNALVAHSVTSGDTTTTVDPNEIVLYAVPYSTTTGFNGTQKTVAGDHATLTLRELNLRTLV